MLRLLLRLFNNAAIEQQARHGVDGGGAAPEPCAGNTGAAVWAAVGASLLLPRAAARRLAAAATGHSQMLPPTHTALQAARQAGAAVLLALHGFELLGAGAAAVSFDGKAWLLAARATLR